MQIVLELNYYKVVKGNMLKLREMWGIISAIKGDRNYLIRG
jgi:hypothetical protein